MVELFIESPNIAVENSIRISELLGTFVAPLAGVVDKTV